MLVEEKVFEMVSELVATRSLFLRLKARVID